MGQSNGAPDINPENEDALRLHNPVAKVANLNSHLRLTGAGGAQMLSRFPEDKIADRGQISMMTPEQLIDRRKRFKMTQAEMAETLGLTLRGYQKLEAQGEPIREAYEMAVAFLGMQKAVELDDATLASKPCRKIAKALALIDKG